MMLIEAGRILLLIILAVGMVAMLRVIFDLLSRGVDRVRDIRQEGGGLKQKLTAELEGGQREPSAARWHGAHFRVTASGELEVRPKSVVARAS
jgi:hypothetical protein